MRITKKITNNFNTMGDHGSIHSNIFKLQILYVHYICNCLLLRRLYRLSISTFYSLYKVDTRFCESTIEKF